MPFLSCFYMCGGCIQTPVSIPYELMQEWNKPSYHYILYSHGVTLNLKTVFQTQQRCHDYSSISGLVAEIFLKYCEHLIVKYMFESYSIIFYIRYVKDILILFVGHKIAAEEIRSYMKHVLKHIEFKLMCEENGTVSFFNVRH